MGYNLLLPETRAMNTVIDADEELQGVVYGRYRDDRDETASRGALIATDKRVVLFNKKFLFRQSDEFSYQVISGVDYSRVGVLGTVTLHTRMGDIHVHTFNKRCAETFVAAIEENIFHSQKLRGSE